MKKFLVIGNPIEHSLSPTLHNYWIKSNNIDAIYEKTKIDENELEPIVLQIKIFSLKRLLRHFSCINLLYNKKIYYI